MDSDEKNKLCSNIKNILNDYEITCYDQLNPTQIDETVQNIFETLEQFYDNLNYSETYELILNTIMEMDSDYEQDEDEDEELETINVGPQTYDSLNELKNELLNTVQEVDDTISEFLKQQFKYLQTVPQPEQRTYEWFEMRKGMCTASDICAILGEDKYKTRNNIVLKKCGKGKPFTGNAYTLHGQRHEDVAIGIYESRRNYVKVHEFGLIAHPNVYCLGASPDGITKFGTMIEIKCPPKRKITGIIPHGYWCQMQIQLEVCNLQICDFFECLIIEYNTKEEYLEDIYDKNNCQTLEILIDGKISNIQNDYINVPNERRGSNGLEKGVIGYVLNTEKDERIHIYPPMNLITREQEKYIDNFIENGNGKYRIYGNKYIYWKLIRSSVNKVKRDRDWFSKNLPKIYEFWEEILKRREKGEHSCNDLLKPKKIKRVMSLNSNFQKININNSLQQGTCYLNDSSDDEIDNSIEQIKLNSQCLIESDEEN